MGELAARILKQAGLTQMPLGPVFVRWAPVHGMKRLTITGAGGIFTKLLDFVSVLLYSSSCHVELITAGVGPLFLKRFKDAWNMRNKHREMFRQLSSTFPEDTIQRWTAMVDAWKVDHGQPNPYEEPQCGMFIVVYIDVLTIVILSSYDCSRCSAPTHTRRCSGGVTRYCQPSQDDADSIFDNRIGTGGTTVGHSTWPRWFQPQ